MERSEKAIVTALCMIYDGDRLLLQDRVKKDWRGFTFPRGHIEKEESFVQGIKREIREETGLILHDLRICGIKQFQTGEDERYMVLLFKTDRFEGEVVSSEEGEMVWIDRGDLQNHSLAEGFPDLLKVFDDENVNEMIYERHRENDSWVWVLKLY